MLNVAVVGDHGSGKTTFLGLVYATLVSSGSAKEDDLRFHLAYDSMEEITGLFQRLMSGGFPDSASKEGIHGLTIELDVAGQGLLSRFGSRKRAEGTAKTVRLSLPGSLDESKPGLTHGSTFGTGRWRDALDADVVVLIVDSTKLAARGTDPKAGPMASYDGRLEALFVAVQRWRSSGGRPMLHPLFVFSKFDLVGSELLKAANLEPVPPDASKTGPRTAYAKALLEPNLPRALALLVGETGKKLKFGPPRFVFSSVRPEAGTPGGPAKIKVRRTASGGWEPDFARVEYLAFLRWLAEVAADTAD